MPSHHACAATAVAPGPLSRESNGGGCPPPPRTGTRAIRTTSPGSAAVAARRPQLLLWRRQRRQQMGTNGGPTGGRGPGDRHTHILDLLINSTEAGNLLRGNGALDRVQLDTDHSSAGADNIGTTVTKRKFQTVSEHFGGDDSDSDSHEQVRLQKETRQLRKPRHTPFPIQVLASADLESLAPELLTRQTSNPVHNTSPTRSLSRKRALHDRVEMRCTVKHKIQTPAVNWK